MNETWRPQSGVVCEQGKGLGANDLMWLNTDAVDEDRVQIAGTAFAQICIERNLWAARAQDLSEHNDVCAICLDPIESLGCEDQVAYFGRFCAQRVRSFVARSAASAF